MNPSAARGKGRATVSGTPRPLRAVASSPEDGTVPCSRVEAAIARIARFRTRWTVTRCPRPSILCIDDEDLGLEIRKTGSGARGRPCRADGDATGRPGSPSSILEQQMDAVVVDYAMPGTGRGPGGGQPCAKRKPAVPILMLSGVRQACRRV